MYRNVSRYLAAAAVGLAVMATGFAAGPQAVAQQTFVVDTTVDSTICDPVVHCSLRGAIIAANVTPTHDTIVLGASETYVLDIPGEAEDASATGDLDVTRELTIEGNGSVVVQAVEDRVLQVTPGANVTIRNLTLTGGSWPTGGGIHNAGTLSLIQSVVSGNAGVRGGGIANHGTLHLVSSTVRENTAADAGDGITIFGGGIHNAGTLHVVSSTISGNSSDLQGGGINSLGSLVITSSTISGNWAAALGGGVNSSGSVAITSSTISGNSAGTPGEPVTQGGGLRDRDGSMSIKASIVAANTVSGVSASGADCFGDEVASQGFNVVGEGGGCPEGTDDLATSDPGLGPLADNGGPTTTHALLDGSPALDHHPAEDTDCTGTTDQRGVSRPQGAACDSGAYEREVREPRPGPVCKLVRIRVTLFGSPILVCL